MLIAGKLIPAAAGLAPALRRRAATVALDWDTRQKSRFDIVDSAGRSIGVFLPRGGVVRGGDTLVVDDGSLVAVTAKPQALVVVTVGPGGAPFDLLRAAYHLGNRHVPLELTPTCLRLEPDPVLAEMLRRMGLVVVDDEAAFEPEAGAYGPQAAGRSEPSHGHAHAHPHLHAHPHPHTQHAHDLSTSAEDRDEHAGPAH